MDPSPDDTTRVRVRIGSYRYNSLVRGDGDIQTAGEKASVFGNVARDWGGGQRRHVGIRKSTARGKEKKEETIERGERD